jgi:hypothetical protein
MGVSPSVMGIISIEKYELHKVVQEPPVHPAPFGGSPFGGPDGWTHFFQVAAAGMDTLDASKVDAMQDHLTSDFAAPLLLMGI